MVHLAEETQVFDFLSCVKFHASSFRRLLKVSFNIHVVSDMNEILSVPRKFLYQNVDYVKLTKTQIYTEKHSLVRRILGNYQDDISRSMKVA